LKTTTLRNLWAAVVVLGLGAAGCGGGTVQVKGKVTDAEGTQSQELVSGVMPLRGSGAVSSAAKVQAATVGPGGKLTVVGEAQVEAQGRYTVDVPAGEERLVLQAVDASGQVLVSTVLDASGEAGSTVAPPMDGESTLEAEVFAQMVADGAGTETVDTVDVRARINSQMAVAARQGASTSEAFRARVKALAEAVRAAQQSELEMYARAGVQTSQEKLFHEELAASAALNVALDAGGSTAEAYEKFQAELVAAAERVGAKVEQQAQGERAAGASFRATLKARLSAQDAQPLVDAAARGSAALEARTTGVALEALLKAAGAADAVTQQAVAAGTRLRGQVRASATASAAAQAFASFETSVATSANVESTVLGSYLGVSAGNQLALSTAVQASASAAATLDAAVDAAALAAVSTSGTNVSLLAAKTADAYQAYATAVRAQAAALTVFGTKAAPAVEVLVLTEGSFQVE
jgi:hypothetical protein